eukprot:jgi/Mesen1/6335/ME000328S05625
MRWGARGRRWWTSWKSTTPAPTSGMLRQAWRGPGRTGRPLRWERTCTSWEASAASTKMTQPLW